MRGKEPHQGKRPDSEKFYSAEVLDLLLGRPVIQETKCALIANEAS